MPGAGGPERVSQEAPLAFAVKLLPLPSTAVGAVAYCEAGCHGCPLGIVRRLIVWSSSDRVGACWKVQLPTRAKLLPIDCWLPGLTAEPLLSMQAAAADAAMAAADSRSGFGSVFASNGSGGEGGDLGGRQLPVAMEALNVSSSLQPQLQPQRLQHTLPPRSPKRMAPAAVAGHPQGARAESGDGPTGPEAAQLPEASLRLGVHLSAGVAEGSLRRVPLLPASQHRDPLTPVLSATVLSATAVSAAAVQCAPSVPQNMQRWLLGGWQLLGCILLSGSCDAALAAVLSDYTSNFVLEWQAVFTSR